METFAKLFFMLGGVTVDYPLNRLKMTIDNLMAVYNHCDRLNDSYLESNQEFRSGPEGFLTPLNVVTNNLKEFVFVGPRAVPPKMVKIICPRCYLEIDLSSPMAKWNEPTA